MRAPFCAVFHGALLAISITASPALARNDCFHVVNVDFWDVLYIRSSATHRSTAVGAIAPDHDGIVLATGPCKPQGQSAKRQWCPVDYYPLPSVRISGFVKAYFIAPAICPTGFAAIP